MVWIESHQALLAHRKTGRLARRLGVGKIPAIGHLHAFWWWCMDNAPDGCLDGIDAEDIADGACWEGDPGDFLDALAAAGFVDVDVEGPVVHDWQEYGGKLLEKKNRNAVRQKEWRERQEAKHEILEQEAPNRDVAVMLPFQKDTQESIGQESIGQDKREEKSKTPKKASETRARVKSAAVSLFEDGFKSVKGRAPTISPTLAPRMVALYENQGDEVYRRALAGFFSCLNGSDLFPKSKGFDAAVFVRQFDTWEGGQSISIASAHSSLGNASRNGVNIASSRAETLAAITGDRHDT